MTARTVRFGGLSVGYDDRVLEPRPWTTAQARWAAELMRRSPAGPVLELCAGVGQIGLLAVTLAPRELVMVDVDENACGLARANIAANRPCLPVDVRCGRIDAVLAAHERFAGVIADPPWVPSRDVGRFPADPLTAIDGGADGMATAWTCVEAMARHLTYDGWGLLQLGTPAQAATVRRHTEESPELGLEVVEIRSVGDRGVLVRLSRPRGPGC